VGLRARKMACRALHHQPARPALLFAVALAAAAATTPAAGAQQRHAEPVIAAAGSGLRLAHDAVPGYGAPVEGLYAASADLSPSTKAASAAACAARCGASAGCVSFNLCGTAAPYDCGVSGYSIAYVPARDAPECAWYRRLLPRNDTALAGGLAVPWALEPPASGVALTGGPLAGAFANNVAQYLATRDPRDMLHFFAQRAGRPLANSTCYGWGGWIPGSEAGNFLMGAGSALRWLAPGSQPALAAAVAAVVDGIADYASPNGWAWAFNESQIGDDNLPDYCAAWVIRGLLDADAAGVPRALDTARRTLDVFNNHTLLPFFMPPNGGPAPVQPFPSGFNNVTDGGYGQATGHMIYIQFQGMIKHTLMARSRLGVQADLDIVAKLLQEEWWLRALVDGDLYRGLWHRTFFSHNYEITGFEAFLDMYVLTGNVTYLNAVDAAWEALRENFVLPGGSLAINEGSYYPPKSYYIGFTGRNVASAHDASAPASADGYYHAPCCAAPGGTCAAAPQDGNGAVAAIAGGGGDSHAHHGHGHDHGRHAGPFVSLRAGAKARGVGVGGPNDSDPPTGELCGSVFWVFLNARLHRLRPDVEAYVGEMEAAALNIGVGALGVPGSGGQGPNGVGIRYFANMHKAKQFPSMHASCCEGQGTRLFGALPEFVFSLGPAQVYVDLYAGASLTTAVPGVPGEPIVSVAVATAWPADDAVAVTLTLPAGGGAVALDLALRMPSWLVSAVSVSVDGVTWPAYGVPGSYLHVSRAWVPGAHTLAFSLPAGFVVHPYSGASQLPPYARVGYSWGAVLLAAEGAWNATVDALVMPAGLDAAAPGEWMQRRAGAELTWDVVAGGKPTGVFFKPYYAVQGADEQFDVYPCFVQS